MPALLTQKKDGSWRTSVDSRAINKITVNIDSPSPDWIMLDMMSGVTIFSKINLKSVDHQIQIRLRDE